MTLLPKKSAKAPPLEKLARGPKTARWLLHLVVVHLHLRTLLQLLTAEVCTSACSRFLVLRFRAVLSCLAHFIPRAVS